MIGETHDELRAGCYIGGMPKILRILIHGQHSLGPSRLVRELERRGHEVVISSNLSTTRNLLAAQPFDLVLADADPPSQSLDALGLSQDRTARPSLVVLDRDQGEAIASSPARLDELLISVEPACRPPSDMVFNHHEVLERLEEPELLVEAALIFEQNLVGLLAELERSVTSQDSQAARRVAHTFKGMCGTLGGAESYQAAAWVENLARNDRLSELPEAFEVFREALDRLRAALAPFRVKPSS